VSRKRKASWQQQQHLLALLLQEISQPLCFAFGSLCLLLPLLLPQTPVKRACTQRCCCYRRLPCFFLLRREPPTSPPPPPPPRLAALPADMMSAKRLPCVLHISGELTSWPCMQQIASQRTR
jgi:hypothetical protein